MIYIRLLLHSKSLGKKTNAIQLVFVQVEIATPLSHCGLVQVIRVASVEVDTEVQMEAVIIKTLQPFHKIYTSLTCVLSAIKLSTLR